MKKKPIKIIEIDTYNPQKYVGFPDINSDYFYVANWGGLWARRLKMRYPELDIEVWRTEPMFSKPVEKYAFDIICKIFPYHFPVVSKVITFKMLRQLKRYEKQYSLVLHLNTIFNFKYNFIAPLLLRKTIFILSHHGGVIPNREKYKSRLKRHLLKLSYHNIQALTYLRRSIKDWIQPSDINLQGTPQLFFLPVGADFSFFKPRNKLKCRKILHLSPEKTYAMYVGRYYKLKGVDHIIKVFNKFKHNNFEVLFVGGTEEDELFQQVVETGCPRWRYTDWEKLSIIYSAADFYIHPAFHQNFGGLDVSWMEALACDIPVISPQFNEFDFDCSEMGITINHENEIFEKVNKMIQTFKQYKNCRKIAIKHLNGNVNIIDTLYKILTMHK